MDYKGIKNPERRQDNARQTQNLFQSGYKELYYKFYKISIVIKVFI